MDYLALMVCYAAGIVSLIFAAKNPAAGFMTHAFSILAGIYLAACFVWLGAKTHVLSPVQWTGEAQTGPITLLVLAISVALPFVVGWEGGQNERDRRRS